MTHLLRWQDISAHALYRTQDVKLAIQFYEGLNAYTPLLSVPLAVPE